MGNMIDYLRWRGDLTLRQKPFNEIDNLLMASLSYVDFEDILVPGEQMTIAGAADAYFAAEEQKRKEESGKADWKDRNGDPKSMWEASLRALAESQRFRDSVLYHTGVRLDDETQFTVLSIGLPDGTIYISFRGTGTTFVGWREDFEISYKHIGAQILAEDYLRKNITGTKAIYRIGGHSKGGHLALTSAIALPPEQQDLIIAVYMNDGPGICPEMLDREGFERIRDKIERVTPQYCVVGKLFEPDVPEKIVASDTKGIMQHYPYTWQVERDHFVEVPVHHQESLAINAIVSEWLESVTMDERESFVSNLFDALAASGAKDFLELPSVGMDGFGKILNSVKEAEPGTQEAVAKLLDVITDRLKDDTVEGLKNTGEQVGDKFGDLVQYAGRAGRKVLAHRRRRKP